MHIERVSFFSEGSKMAGVLHVPDARQDARPPIILQGPGWLETACSPTSEPYHRGLVEAGYALLQFDYRGYGGSEGERGWIRPQDQIEDIHNAIAYLRTRDDVDIGRLGLFGVGGTGGGNAIYVAAAEPLVRCVAVQTVVADGPEWLRRMRREHEWVDFKRRVDENRLRRVRGGEDELVEPREELMVATPERKAERSRAVDDAKVGGGFHLSSAESLMRYRPLDVVDRIAPRALLLTCVEDDVVTPADHAIALYERAGAPKKLIRQSGVKHYESYTKNYDLLLAQILDWYGRHLSPLATSPAQPPTAEVVRL